MSALLDPRRIALALAAPALALTVAMLLSSIALLAIGESPLAVFRTMLDFGTTGTSLVAAVNRATPYYLSGIAVAIGFRMGLFNIGVDGQYRIAALLSAAAGAAVSLPGPLHTLFIVVVAMAAGAAWAGIAGILKAGRGVSEVISTIMLNYVATGLAAYLLADYLSERVEGSNNVSTPTLPESSWVGSLSPALRSVGIAVPERADVLGFVVVAVVVGVAYHLVLARTRFGFDLRATGLSPSAAQASGVNPRRMIVITMLCSGALAGLVGMPQLLGVSHNYGLDFPASFGFTGIAVALLGRNNALGIAFAALLFGFLERSSQVLDLDGIPKEIVSLMQGSILISVVVAYELVRRLRVAQAERDAQNAGRPEVSA